MVALLAAIGDEHIVIQNLMDNMTGATRKKNGDVQVSFVTSPNFVDLSAIAAGSRGEFSGMVLWLRRAEIEKATKAISAQPARKGVRVTSIDLAETDACDILTTAVSAGHTYGIGYWAIVQELTDTTLTITERDTDGHTPIVLKAADIKRAALALLAGNSGANGFVKQLIEWNIDGPLADALVQIACFGELKYS